MKKSIVFCGTPQFAVPSLAILAADPQFAIELVVTQPDKPVGRKQELTPPPVKIAAERLGLPVFQPKSLNKELHDSRFMIHDSRPDFLVVVAYGQLLSQEILDLPTVAPINVHGSLLPTWRGASPIEHAVLHGDSETGVTIQRMVLGLDAGPILAIQATAIGERETALELRERLSLLGATLLHDTLRKPLHETPQDGTLATYCRKLSRDDAKADPATMTAEDIDRRVHALVPWPGVIIEIDGEPLKILSAELSPTKDSTPLACKDSTLHLVSVQPAGKKPMSGKAWANGRQSL